MRENDNWLSQCFLGIGIALLTTSIIWFIGIVSDTYGVREQSADGVILTVEGYCTLLGYTDFTITLDLDDGRVVVCPVQSDLYGGTLYRLYRNRKPDLPRLRETARVQVGRHSKSVVCRGLVIAEMTEEIEQ